MQERARGNGLSPLHFVPPTAGAGEAGAQVARVVPTYTVPPTYTYTYVHIEREREGVACVVNGIRITYMYMDRCMYMYQKSHNRVITLNMVKGEPPHNRVITLLLPVEHTLLHCNAKLLE